ncbi:MAG: HAMP domain-containing histidine kinase [Thermoanaerobaculales bacterium]|jgi:signal transduction histidine kinase|nr:HAMP domain-containing histidine kinase [Thermoanaerobaculales bacterium]
MRSLHTRLVAVLLGLLLFLGASLIAVSLATTRRYEEEVVQRLNRALASSLVAEDLLLVDGEVNERALEQVFHTLEIINPSIEVYLLDLEGRVVQHSASAGRVLRDRVDIAPVKAFLEAGAKLPIRGDDPLDDGRRKVFSVSPIMVEDRYEGYLYVVLASEASDSVVQRLRGSHILRLGLAATGLALAAAAVAGVTLFTVLTRRLRRLAAVVEAFRRSDFTRPVRLDGRPGGGDEIDTLSATFEDMSERIIQQVRTLRQTDELRRELVANVSHDLRTPLASLTGYIETLQLKQGRITDQERDQYLAVARRQSERLGTLVEELFELARLESRDMAPELEPFPLPELVQDVVQEFRLGAERKGVAIAFAPPDEVPLVSADIGLIQRALQNLIGNALTHTEAGGRVTVSIEPGVDKVAVRIEDTGCGIPGDELEQIFDRFYQVRNQGQRQSAGGGLGLAIVKRILELHGSAIEAASTVGKGTVFTFSLATA